MSLIGPIETLVRHRALASELARRDILDRYLSQAVGGIWAVLNPLLIMGLYVFLFTTVFPARLDGYDGGIWAGVTYLLAGLSSWLVSAEILNRSTTAIADNSNLVKQIVFPVDAIPLKTVFVAMFSFGVTLAPILLIAALYRPESLVAASYLLPAAILLHFSFLLGVSYFLSSFGAFFRDLKDAVAFFSAAGLFLAPILYFPERLASMPAPFATAIKANPFSHFVYLYQDSFLYGEIAHPGSWLACVLMALAAPLIGYALFKRLSPQFGDVV